jgi:butyryl-CoA dehydrogenase
VHGVELFRPGVLSETPLEGLPLPLVPTPWEGAPPADLVELGLAPADADLDRRRFPRVRVPADARGLPNAEALDAADIVLVGDSFLVSAGSVEPPGLVARMSQETGSSVYALAIAGIGPLREAWLLEEVGLALEPDLVIWFFFGGNDLADAKEVLGHALLGRRVRADLPDYRPPPRFRIGALLGSFLAGDRPETAVTDGPLPPFLLPAPAGAAEGEPLWLSNVYLGRTTIDHWKGHQAWRATVTALREARDSCFAVGASFCIVYLPSKAEASLPALTDVALLHRALAFGLEGGVPLTPTEAHARMLANRRSLDAALAELCAAEEIPYFSATPYLEALATSGRSGYLVTDTHCARSGRRRSSVPCWRSSRTGTSCRAEVDRCADVTDRASVCVPGRAARLCRPPLQETDPMPQNVVFSELALELQAKAREIADKHVRPLAAKYDKAQEYNREAAQAAAEAGLFRVFIPEEYGGYGAGTLALALVTEELAKADSGFGVAYAVNALGTTPIVVGGTEEQKQHFLPKIAAGEKFVAFCLSEKNAGSDAGGLAVTAERDGDEYVICGEKKWTTNGGVADIYSVFCVTDPTSKSRRISAIVVEKGTPGFTVGKIEDKMGIRCVPVVETHFDNVRVPAANLIGGREGMGFKHAMMTLDRARPGVAAQAIGAAQGALDLALVYANRRKQFGKPISAFQMVQKMLADAAMKTEAARWLVYAAAASTDAGVRNVTKLAAMSKCFATDVAMDVATDAVQIFGGYGFMEDYPIAKFFRDAKILQIYEGTNQVQRMVIARNLIKEAEELAHLEEYIPREEQQTFKDAPVETGA